MPERRDQLDQALDDALASYGEAPANEGLERRVLARVAGRAKHAHPIGPLVLAIGAAVIVVMACLLWWMTPKTAVQNLRASTTPPALRKVETPRKQTIPLHGRAAVRTSTAKPRRIRKKPAEPKLPVFPTPSPLSSEERALVRLVISNAKELPRELTYLGSPIEPIQITAVEINPL